MGFVLAYLNTALGVSVLIGAVIGALVGVGLLAGGRTYGWGPFALTAKGFWLVSSCV